MRNEPIKLHKNVMLAKKHTHTHKISLWGCTSKSNFLSPLTSALSSLEFLLNHLVIDLHSGKEEKKMNPMINFKKELKWQIWFGICYFWYLSFFTGRKWFLLRVSLWEDNFIDCILLLVNKVGKYRSNHMQPKWKRKGILLPDVLKGYKQMSYIKKFSFEHFLKKKRQRILNKRL